MRCARLVGGCLEEVMVVCLSLLYFLKKLHPLEPPVSEHPAQPASPLPAGLGVGGDPSDKRGPRSVRCELMALNYHNPASLNCKDKRELRNFIVWPKTRKSEATRLKTEATEAARRG